MAKYVNIDKIPYTRIRYEDGFDVEFSPKLAFKEDIDKMPSADVRENIHGKWIDYDDDYGSLACSICNKDAPNDIPWDFCPYCGADMRGEKV